MSFFLGALISFLGSFNPSILTLTSLKIGIQSGKRAGYLFATGVCLIIAIQAFVSLEFASFINENPFVERNIQIIGCVIFFLLSVYFFKLGKGTNTEASNKKINKPFLEGLLLSLLNIFSIMFYAGIGLGLNYGGWLEFEFYDMLWFSLGSALGSFAFLLIVVNAAKFIESKISLLSNNINYILGGLTSIVAVLTLISLIP